eukprot:CAMPEP_0171291706 /NCGR_PEP_ID=MMETSP0790-20130122/71787_1 /TAXON_ID=2925 /ORGANISM="Alexandrium catenella, Strain OF101" /LENGTH=272 /DNA_ID=CAMNT_0011761431 /DNA_START=76 /DNA_END=891 /DNA_ORIENTATION=+
MRGAAKVVVPKLCEYRTEVALCALAAAAAAVPNADLRVPPGTHGVGQAAHGGGTCDERASPPSSFRPGVPVPVAAAPVARPPPVRGEAGALRSLGHEAAWPRPIVVSRAAPPCLHGELWPTGVPGVAEGGGPGGHHLAYVGEGAAPLCGAEAELRRGRVQRHVQRAWRCRVWPSSEALGGAVGPGAAVSSIRSTRRPKAVGGLGRVSARVVHGDGALSCGLVNDVLGPAMEGPLGTLIDALREELIGLVPSVPEDGCLVLPRGVRRPHATGA